jgi:S-adenosyl-L-methionine hydrolase (adenosine-forming)
VIVTLLTDYGTDDEFAGVCHGVIRSICPDCTVLDVTHGIRRHSIRHGAIVLRNALPYMPAGVHVAIVDPEVGTERRALALRCDDGRVLVGPDNGLLAPAAERFGGIVDAVDVSRSPHRLEPVSATFHGRDIFCPVAAHLAGGAELADAGERVDPEDVMSLDLPAPSVADGTLSAHALVIDRFGNVGLDAGHGELAGSGLTLGRSVEVRVQGARHEAAFARSFADVGPGTLLVYEDAYRTLALAVNRGDAAELLGVAPDDEILLAPL